MSRALVLLALLAACAPATSTPGALTAQRVAPAEFVVVGHVLVFLPPVAPQYRVRAVVVTADGKASRIWFERFVRSGMQISPGDSVTAWCTLAGADTVADSVRVEHRP